MSLRDPQPQVEALVAALVLSRGVEPDDLDDVLDQLISTGEPIPHSAAECIEQVDAAVLAVRESRNGTP